MAADRLKSTQLRDMSVDELRKRTDELAIQLFELRKKQATGQVDNPARIRTLRRERARVLTILGERQG
jgi:large subunit ribosomal protein L29